MTDARRYCGRAFSDTEFALIRTLIAEHDPPLNRAALSRAVCERLDWRKPDGGLKDMSARVALLRMHREGVIALPPARKRPGPRKPPVVSRISSWNPRGNWPVCSVDGLPGMTEQSGKRSVVKLPFP